MDENSKNHIRNLRNNNWNRWWRIPRLFLYFFGIFTFFWYFWSIIGLLIGLILFILSKDIAWKRNGILLTYSIAFITLLVFYYKAFSPLNLAIWSGLGIFLSFAISLLIIAILKKKFGFIKNSKSKIINSYERFSRKARIVARIITIIIPLISWSMLSIDVEVIFDNSPRLLWIHAPSTVNTNETFELAVEAWDQFERLSATYIGIVSFSLLSINLTTYTEIFAPIASLPDDYSFTGQIFGSDIAYEIKDGKDNGIHIFDISIETPGIHYVLVNESYTNNLYFSNPIIVKNQTNNEKNIVWGDLHTHTGLSDGTGTLEHSYYYARYIARLDFNAITDHGEILMWNPSSLNYLESVTNNAYASGDFVTFHGIEWTQVKTGHYTCIFSGNQLLKEPLLSYILVPTTQDLWNTLDSFTQSTGARALALPHHTTKRAYPQDWIYINPKYVKIAEVSSVHGDFLFEHGNELNYRGAIDPPPLHTRGSSIMDAFTMGYRMTLYSSSDEHDGHPGHSLSHTRAYIGHQRPFSTWLTRNEHPYPGGLTAAFVDNLTREGVFSGLENQRIYANSDHGRPILIFSINGTKVGDGSTLNVNNQNSHRLINIFLAQDGAPVAKMSEAASVTANWDPNWEGAIEIMKNGELWQSRDILSPIANVSIVDTTPITGTTYEPNCVEIDGQFYVNQDSDNPIIPNNLNTNGFDYYLVRFVGDNGRMSWVGPIWVEY
ncbi:MAG: DUF3604 domain-containing protein [Candidatus Lokiarchaeota archaeon]|nr:DUF3604 domain-containing protein [Candidatus Lokiarchaeota archaeon]